MKVNVAGSLSNILEGFPDIENNGFEKLIGLAINENGKQIGVITKVDMAADLWWGVIEREGEIIELGKTCSCEIVRE